MTQIHGHEVLQMMMNSGASYTRASLEREIVANFGPDARFYTCSAENMTAAELVDFLDARGKLVQRGDGFNTSPEVMCRH